MIDVLARAVFLFKHPFCSLRFHPHPFISVSTSALYQHFSLFCLSSPLLQLSDPLQLKGVVLGCPLISTCNRSPWISLWGNGFLLVGCLKTCRPFKSPVSPCCLWIWSAVLQRGEETLLVPCTRALLDPAIWNASVLGRVCFASG